MPKVPGITTDLLQKQILKLLEEIGIPAKDWIGKGGSQLRRLVTKTGISPFKPDMVGALSQQKKTFGDALDLFSNEAKFMMNANDQELMNFKNNIIDFTNIGGTPRGSGGEGLGSMMKTLDDLGTEAKNLKTTAEEMKELALKNIKDLEDSLKYGGDPFKVPDKTSVGGDMYTEGNIRTAVREFMQSEVKAGRLKLNEVDAFRVREYSPMGKDDPILVFRRIYGEDALDAVDNISSVFEKGESFKHYEQLLRENVDEKFLTQKTTGVGELDPNVKAAEDIRTKVEEGEIKPLKPDDDDIPFYAGGRVGLKYGTKKLFNFTKKQLRAAVEDIFPTGDRKYDAEMVSDALVENNPKMFKNKLRDDLLDNERTEIYGAALNALDAFNAEARALMKPKSKGKIWKDEKGETAGIAMGFSESEIPGLDKAMQKGIALSNAMKAMKMDPASSKQTLEFDKLVSEGMIDFPRDIKEQIIRAKYGDVVDERLLNNLLIDDDPQRLVHVMGTIDEGLIMQEKGMGPDEIIEAIKASLDRKPQAYGGGVGSLFAPTDRVGLFRGTGGALEAEAVKYAGKTMKQILDGLMKYKKIRNLVKKVNEKLHETGIAKMFYQDRTLSDKDKIIAGKVIAPFVDTVDKLLPWKTTEKSQKNATLAWFRESITNPEWKEVYHPDWEKGKTVFRGMKHPEDLQYSKEHPSNMFINKEHAKMFKPENVGGFASESPSHAIRFAADAKGFPHVTKTHLSPIEFQEGVERNLLENPYGITSDVILDAEKKAALETDIMATGIAAFKKYWPFSKGGPVSRQQLYEDGVGSMFKEV